MYAGFAAGLPRFLRQRVTLESAREMVATRLRAREENFLRLSRLTVFDRPESPYHFIMREARCEPGDVESLVRRDGLDAALRALELADVRVSFDEFKGRTPIVRNGRVLEIKPDAFDNPLGSRNVESQTTGSTGAATRVNMNLDHVFAMAPARLLAETASGVSGLPLVIFRAGFPSSAAVGNILQHIVIGNPVRRWFSPIAPGEVAAPGRFRAAGALIPILVRLSGQKFPKMEVVRFSEAVVVARSAAEYARAEGGCVVSCPVSSALTVCIAAGEHEIDLRGVTFMGAAEPATPAKIRGIRRSGATYVTRYGMNETGIAGAGCGRGIDETDVHLLRDALALVPVSRAPAIDEGMTRFALTSLLPTAPKILINTDVDDFGIVEERSCGCLLGDLGLTQHLRKIGSAAKLTGRGITLLGSDVVRIVEDILPTRFGGTANDYQLVEEEDADGQTVLTLLVSPTVRVDDERAPAALLYEELSRGSPGASFSGAILRSADAVRVRRDKPFHNARGKLPAFRTSTSRT